MAKAKKSKGKGAATQATQSPQHKAWAKRHPARAAQERSFRKGRAVLLERWAHKNEGTPETHEAHAQRRAGAIARLHASGYLNDDELAWSQEIAAVAERIAAAVAVRTANLAGRVDSSRHGDAFFEALAAVWGEMSYSRWREQLRGAIAGVVLDIIVHDVGVAAAAAAHGMSVARAKRELTDALARWAEFHRRVRDEVTPADLLAAQSGLFA